MTYTAGSPAVIRAVNTYYDHRGIADESMAAVLNEHKRILKSRLAATEAVRDQLREELARVTSERDAERSRADDLAAKLPAWQPIEPDDIRPGMRVRGTGASHTVELVVASRSASWVSDGADGHWHLANRTWEADPRTIPADPEPEPMDPDAGAIEAMARASWGEGVPFPWSEAADQIKESYRMDARVQLAAYRAHIEEA